MTRPSPQKSDSVVKIGYWIVQYYVSANNNTMTQMFVTIQILRMFYQRPQDLNCNSPYSPIPK